MVNFLILLAYPNVRTEPQSDIVRNRGKKVFFRGSRGAPFGEGTLSPVRRYLKPLPKGDGGRGGVNEELKPP